jgi:radical SAM protein with 4Fe4S-binding SPASM domain
VDSRFNLREIKLEVTYRCPLACIHCSSDATPLSPLEMTPDECFRILQEAVEMGVDQVAFSGGEPLIWGGLDRAVYIAAHAGMQVSVYTSGNVPSVSERIGQLVESGLHTCIFSIFGAAEGVHEQITRAEGSYQGTRAAISAATDRALKVELHFVPLSTNFRELEEIAVTARSWGVSRISVLRLVPQGRGSLIRGRLLNRLQNLQLKRIIEQLRSQGFDIRTGSPYNFLMLNDQPKCSSGIDRLIVGPDLRIYPCDAFKQVKAEELVGTLRLSSLKDSSLLDCWRASPFFAAVRKYLSTPFAEPCASCKARDRCLSGCLAQKVIEHGDFEKRPDPMCLMV